MVWPKVCSELEARLGCLWSVHQDTGLDAMVTGEKYTDFDMLQLHIMAPQLLVLGGRCPFATEIISEFGRVVTCCVIPAIEK